MLALAVPTVPAGVIARPRHDARYTLGRDGLDPGPKARPERQRLIKITGKY